MKLFHNDVCVVKEEGPDLDELGLGDELCSDCFKYSVYKEVWYRFIFKTRTDNECGDYNTGGNASVEEAAEGVDASSTTGIDAVMNHRLATDATISTKKDLKKYIKTYYPALKKVAAVKNNLELDSEELAARMAKVQEVFKELLSDEVFENCEFYSGENHNLSGTHLIIMWDGTTPYGYLPIDGVCEVKY